MNSRVFIYISLAADALMAVIKFIAAAITGSSAMVSEGIHSVIDTISQLLLLWGIRTSKKKADEKRPFGYGKEFYFWSFIVSLIIFTLGGCISFYEGIHRFKREIVETNQTWSYVVLAVAFVFTAASAAASLQVFNAQRGSISFLKAVHQSKDPATFIILLGDMGDLLGLVVAFLGIYLGHRFHNSYYDGIASILIGIILITISGMLVKESRSLLIGEPISKRTLTKIIALAEADTAVIKVRQQLSMHLAPEEVVLQLIAVFKKDLTTQQITDAIERIIDKIQRRYPRVKQLFIEPAANE